MEGTDVKTWEDLEKRIADLKSSHQTAHGGLLFRGHGNSSWPLQTTLERRSGPTFRVRDYYRVVRRIQIRVETFTNTQWTVADRDKVEKLTASWDQFTQALIESDLPDYKHLIYLRHHGFPSPLLDWTASLYVAAYFAFANPLHDSVSIFVYCDAPENVKHWDNDYPMITRLQPNVQTHKRHFLQQSEYSVCTHFKKKEWLFVPHAEVLQRTKQVTSPQDLLWKFNIPASEQVKVLRQLEEYNLNAYSLFGSEESLMETLAIRELLLQPNDWISIKV
jgi:FRG domain